MPVHVTTTTSQTLSNKGFSGPVKFEGNVTISGDLSCSGTQTFNNTIFSTTSAVSVVHIGSGPALWVGNDGTGDIASFYDIDSNVEVFHVGGNNGTFPNVGVKTSTPNVDFTVNGEISAASIIYDTSGNSNQWNNAYSTVQTNSAAWGAGGGGGETAIGITIDGAGYAITTGDKGSITIPYNATLNNVTMIADVSGVCIVDIFKSNFSTYPTSSSICSTSLPTISGAIKSVDASLAGWDTNIQSGDILDFQVLSASNITKLNLTIGATKY